MALDYQIWERILNFVVVEIMKGWRVNCQVWQGYKSRIFVEMSKFREMHVRSAVSRGNVKGEL